MTRVGPGTLINAVRYADAMAGAGGDTDRYAKATRLLADLLDGLSVEHLAQVKAVAERVVEACSTSEISRWDGGAR